MRFFGDLWLDQPLLTFGTACCLATRVCILCPFHHLPIISTLPSPFVFVENSPVKVETLLVRFRELYPRAILFQREPGAEERVSENTTCHTHSPTPILRSLKTIWPAIDHT